MEQMIVHSGRDIVRTGNSIQQKCSCMVAGILIPFLSPQMHGGALQPPGFSGASASVTLGSGSTAWHESQALC